MMCVVTDMTSMAMDHTNIEIETRMCAIIRTRCCS
jgi:hypothetical protein